MGDSIKQYMARPNLYANIDGTTEMCWGVMVLGFAMVGYVETVFNQHSIRLSGFYQSLFFYLVFAPFWCLGYFGTKAIKRHVTYPRTGYVTYRNMKGLSWVKVAVVAAISTAIAAGIFAFALRQSTVTPLRLAIAVGITVAYCLFGLLLARTQPWKWLVYGLLAVGIAAILLKSGDTGRTALLLAGCTYLASGAVTFWLYIRRTQPAASEGE